MSRTPPPHILFVFADQMHGFALGCMGNSEIRTPHLDALARRGTLFRQAYSCAPICTPYRAMLMSGRYSTQTGCIDNHRPLPPGECHLAQGLNQAGYHTSYVGKWHIGGNGNRSVPPELRYGFTDFIGYQCYNSYIDGLHFFDEAEQLHEFTGHRTTVTTDLAIARLQQARRQHADKPLALMVSYQNPHYPVQPAPEFEALYAQARITTRANHRPETEPWIGTFSPRSLDPQTDINHRKYGGNMAEYLRLYYAMITQLDHEVGRLLAELERQGMADHTQIVFTSDHGDLQGSHGFTNKSRFYEESTRVPLIIAPAPGSSPAPGIARGSSRSGASGQVIDTPVGSIDLTATLLDWAQLDPSAPHWRMLEGQSLAPLVRGEQPQPPRPVFIEEIGFPGVVIRSGAHKLVLDRHAEKVTHLYDLEADPCELNNRVDDPALQPVQRELQHQLMQWYAGIESRANPQRQPLTKKA